jgi:uncharacterized protein
MKNSFDKKPIIKPSDAKSWSLCARRVWFDNHLSEGIVKVEVDPFDELIIAQGLAHEATVLNTLSSQYSVQEAHSVEHTAQLMSEGVKVIYQAQLENTDEGFIGYPDFLIQHENGEYQPADAKLAQKTDDKTAIKVQMGLYRRLLGTSLPGLVYLGSGEIKEIGDEVNPTVNRFVTEMREVLASPEQPLVRYSHSKCKICPYLLVCKPQFEKAEDTSLLYGVKAQSANSLSQNGINTISELAQCDPEALPKISHLPRLEQKQRAVLQAQSWQTGEIFKLNDIVLPEGTWIHFDVEDNPLEPSGKKHVYLWGFLKPNYDSSGFEYSWTDTMEEDKQGWDDFLSLVEKYKTEHKDLIIAHYSQHEVTTIKQYAERYDMFEHPTVEWLLGENSPLYDLQKPVLDNLVLPLQGYGLKDICKHKDLVNFQWEDEESGSQWSIVQFYYFQQEQDEGKRSLMKRAILSYNRDDVMATKHLEDWLRSK